MVITLIIQLSVSFFDVIFLAEHDYRGALVCWFDYNVCTLSEVPEGISFYGQEVVCTSFIFIYFQLSFHVRPDLFDWAGKASGSGYATGLCSVLKSFGSIDSGSQSQVRGVGSWKQGVVDFAFLLDLLFE